MTEVTLEQAICSGCGVDVRENTYFCYNCGASVSVPEETANGTEEPASEESRLALDELSRRFAVDREEDERLAKAAAERRKARIRNRKTPAYRWDAEAGPSVAILLLAALLVTLVAIIMVVFTVFWK